MSTSNYSKEAQPDSILQANTPAQPDSILQANTPAQPAKSICCKFIPDFENFKYIKKEQVFRLKKL